AFAGDSNRRCRPGRAVECGAEALREPCECPRKEVRERCAVSRVRAGRKSVVRSNANAIPKAREKQYYRALPPLPSILLRLDGLYHLRLVVLQSDQKHSAARLAVLPANRTRHAVKLLQNGHFLHQGVAVCLAGALH